LIDADARGDYLGAGAAIVKFIRGTSAGEVLREALERLGEDRSFELTNEDEQYRLLDNLAGDVDFLLSGHTHLERCLPRKKGRGTYYNSGTWVRLIALSKATLADQASFAAVFAAFNAGAMQALDDHPGLVIRKPGVIAICVEQGRVSAELRHAGLEPSEPILSPVPGSRVDS